MIFSQRVSKVFAAVLVVCAVQVLFFVNSYAGVFDRENISFCAGIDYTSQYFSRGILYENEGLLIQPYVQATTRLYEDCLGPVNSIDWTAGLWHSFNSNKTGADPASNIRSWYETDLYNWLSFQLWEKYTLATAWHVWWSPSNAFSRGQTWRVKLSYDDSGLLGPWALQPHLMYLKETENESDYGQGSGEYLEVGIAPGFTLIDRVINPVSISFPVTVGFGLDDYYQDASGDDEAFGYVNAGVVLSMPLEGVSEKYGSWSVHAGLDFLYLGQNAESLNDGDEFEILAKAGLSVSF